MYSTCLFCNKPLGANETFETFPVGKRLAFDAAKGRLWVVCPECERWNLTPLEERWEAIESAERIYRDSRRRVSTDNIGLAKLRDGTTLVRIGSPLRPEFAAWRYGDQFGRRRRRQMLIVGGGVAAVGALVVGGAMAGAAVGSLVGGINPIVQLFIRGRPSTVVAKINTEAYGLVRVRRQHLGGTSLSVADDGSLAIDLEFEPGEHRPLITVSPTPPRRGRFEGREAQRIASIVIPKVNRFGGDKAAVRSAVDEIERAKGPSAYLDQLARTSRMYPASTALEQVPWWKYQPQRPTGSTGLFGLPSHHRLALEMALHEETERRALDGELSVLEQAWREAEEIAAISDDLLTPPSVTASIARMHGDAREEQREPDVRSHK